MRKSKKQSAFSMLFLIALPFLSSSQSTIKTIAIGSQNWAIQNLEVVTFRNGDSISEAKTDEDWQKASAEEKPVWCYYDNDTVNGKSYGKLYNWFAVNDQRELAPKGFHIPKSGEWAKGIEYLQGKEIAGKNMKSLNGWNNKGNGSKKNSFNGLPGGYRYSFGPFENIGISGNWWCSVENSDFFFLPNFFYLNCDNSEAIIDVNSKGNGMAVRCIQDEAGFDYKKETKINKQIWTISNLNVSAFRNGDIIPEVKTDEEWEKANNERKPAWCYFYNDTALGKKYGKLYNWFAVSDSRELAPIGWHIPSDKEWVTLSDFYGGMTDAGKKLKASNGWAQNANGTNESDLTLLPGGSREGGNFSLVNFYGEWWSSTNNDKENAWSFSPEDGYGKTNLRVKNKGAGFSVRCIKD